MAIEENANLKQVLTCHAKKYPKMLPCDAVKLVFQNEFGGGHLIPDGEAAWERLAKEYIEIQENVEEPLLEEIGNGLVRVMLGALKPEEYPLEKVCEDFIRSSAQHKGDKISFLKKLNILREVAGEGTFGFSKKELEYYLKDYIASGCPPVSHSEVYREAYRPSYRVILRSEISALATERAAGIILRAAARLLERKPSVVISIDGRCASGKTTLAMRLAELCGCSVVHMDDFFLRPEQRTAQRYEEPGGNVDRERFLEEVLLPMRRGETVVYRSFDCGTQSLKEPVELKKTPVTVVEGSYSCHPELVEYYDLKVFLSVSSEKQMVRIIDREGEAYAQVFREKWIPLEERYFAAFEVEKCCDLTFDMT